MSKAMTCPHCGKKLKHLEAVEEKEYIYDLEKKTYERKIDPYINANDMEGKIGPNSQFIHLCPFCGYEIDIF